MPKLPKKPSVYIIAFLTLLLVGVAAIYYLSQNEGLNFVDNDKKQQIIEKSNVLDDPQSTLFASCTHEKMPYIRISKGVEQVGFDAVATYSRTASFENPIQIDIPAGKAYVDIELPTVKIKSEQIYTKITYSTGNQEATDDVYEIRVDPCNVEYKNI